MSYHHHASPLHHAHHAARHMFRWYTKPKTIAGVIVRIVLIGTVLVGQMTIPQRAKADLDGCYVILTPNTIGTNAERTLSLSIENQDSNNNIVHIRFVVNADLFTIVSGSASGWSAEVNGNEVIFTGGSIAPYGSKTFLLTLHAGPDTSDTVGIPTYTSDQADGSNDIGCDGNVGISVVDSSSSVSINGLSVSGVTDVAAVISFTTNTTATSLLRYGTTTSYGTTQTTSTGTTTHSYSLSGLTRNTTYYYQVTATAGSSTDSSGDRTFTTSAVVGATPAPAEVITNTPAPTATPTPVPDTQPPVIIVNPLAKAIVKTVPTIRGTAADNRKVMTLSYTTDNGKHWKELTNTSALETSFAGFSLTPKDLGDGNWTVKIQAQDSSGNTAVSSPVSFSLDRTGPQVNVTTDLTQTFAASPTIAGTATDPSGEATVEFSLDGSNWQPADRTSTNGSITSFDFSLPPLDDGNYTVSVRATDALGNTAPPLHHPFVIDRLPPRVGGTLLFVGPQVLTPNSNNLYTTISNLSHDLILSLVGGVTHATLTIATKTPGSEQSVSLAPMTVGSLWRTSFSFAQPGTYSLTLDAVDGANRKLHTSLGQVQVLPPGTIHGNNGRVLTGKITVFARDASTGTFAPWEGLPYNQQNPVITSPSRGWNLFLPTGTYYIEISSSGYKTIKSTQFSFADSSPLATDITLQPASFFSLPFLTNLLFPSNQNVLIPSEQQVGSVWHTSSIEILPDFSLKTADEPVSAQSLKGKRTLMTLLNTWGPQTVSQLNELQSFASQHRELQVVAIFPHESLSALTLYRHRGAYTLTMLADPDGDLIEHLPYPTVPTHYFIDTNGHILETANGVLSLSQLNQTVNNN